MSKRDVNYPHTIGFRVTDNTWFRIQQEIAQTDLTPQDWCRLVVLDRLSRGYSLSKNERLLFSQFTRVHYLIVGAFRLLANDKFTLEEWEKLRIWSKKFIDRITDHALEEFQLEQVGNDSRSAGGVSDEQR